MYCTIRVAKTKALISFAATAKLICVFVFAYAKIRFSHDAAHIVKVGLHVAGICIVFHIFSSKTEIVCTHSLCFEQQ